MQIIMVSIVVAINVAAALLLRYATHFKDTEIIILGLLLGTVLCLNVIKFGLWGYIHKHFDLSTSYPMAAIFYPIIYVISIYYGETFFQVSKVIGTLLIVSGTMIIHRK